MHGLWTIKTYVKGIEVKVTERTIAEALRMDLEGARWIDNGHFVQHNPGYTQNGALDRLNQWHRLSTQGFVLL